MHIRTIRATYLEHGILFWGGYFTVFNSKSGLLTTAQELHRDRNKHLYNIAAWYDANRN
jgi:hypothetical protein